MHAFVPCAGLRKRTRTDVFSSCRAAFVRAHRVGFLCPATRSQRGRYAAQLDCSSPIRRGAVRGVISNMSCEDTEEWSSRSSLPNAGASEFEHVPSYQVEAFVAELGSAVSGVSNRSRRGSDRQSDSIAGIGNRKGDAQDSTAVRGNDVWPRPGVSSYSNTSRDSSKDREHVSQEFAMFEDLDTVAGGRIRSMSNSFDDGQDRDGDGLEFSAGEQDAYAAIVLANRFPYADREAGDTGTEEDSVYDRLYESYPSPSRSDSQSDRMILDPDSVRRLSLLASDEAAADSEPIVPGVSNCDDLATTREHVLERRKRVLDTFGRGKDARSLRENPSQAILHGRIDAPGRPFGSPRQRPASFAMKTKGGDVVMLPFQPVDKVAEERNAQFKAMLQAVDHLPLVMDGSPLCNRCRTPTLQKELDAYDGGICSSCFCEIHEQRNSVASLGDQDPGARYRTEEQIAEVKMLEKRATDAALLVTQRHIARRKSAASAAQSRAMTASGGSVAERLPGGTAVARGGAGTRERGSTGNGEAGGVGSNGFGSGTSRVGEAGGEWNVKASDRSMRTINPIRQLVQGIAGGLNPAKSLIDLSVGDPTRYGNLRVGEDITEEYCSIVRSGKHNGYTHSTGSIAARRAVAARYSVPGMPRLDEEDVVLTAGVSGALEMALGALANEGDNVLLPRPGFPLFKTMLDGFGVEARYYSILPDESWEVNVEDFARQADDRTVAIVVNNPSNPCGSVYSAAHIRSILAAASQLRLPIVADEVYSDMAFSGAEFTSIASQSADVPVLSVGGASKQFVVPGWRAGWLLIHDRNGVLEGGGVRTGIRQLSTRMLMTNAPVQALLPRMLETGTSSPAFQSLMADLESNATTTMAGLADCVGLTCVPPQGSMYLMAKVDTKQLGFADDLEFTKELRTEESVFVLPGQCFLAPDYVRIVFCAPPEVLREATDRIKAFCARRAAMS
jgi:tyrosine aminotransferase